MNSTDVVYVFYMAGLTGNVNLISSGVQYALFILFTLVTFFFIDKTGRRPLLIYGAIDMGVCHFVVGGVLGSYGEYVDSVQGDGNIKITVINSPNAAHTVIAFSYLLIIAYALTLAPVARVYASGKKVLGTPVKIQDILLGGTSILHLY